MPQLRDRITELERALAVTRDALTPLANYGAATESLAKYGDFIGKNWAADPEHVITRCGGAVLTVGNCVRATEVLKERP